MKFATLMTFAALIAFTAPAFAINDTVANGSVVVGGANQGVINNNSGLGAGGTVNTGSTNTNVNTALGGSAKSSSDSSSFSSSSAKQSQNQGQFQSSTSSVKGSGNSENSNTAVVNQNFKRPAANGTFAPGLVGTFDCLGSKSGGVGLYGVTVSGGGTEVNDDCVNVFLSRELERKGDSEGSWGVLCESEKVARRSPKCKAVAEPKGVVTEQPVVNGSSIKPEPTGRKN